MQRNQVGQGVPVPARRRSLPALPVRVHRPRARAERRGIPAGTGTGTGRGESRRPPRPAMAARPLRPPHRVPAPRIAPGLPQPALAAAAARGHRGSHGRHRPPARGQRGAGRLCRWGLSSPWEPPGTAWGGICPLLSPDVYVGRGAFVPHGCPGSSGRAGGGLARCTGHKGPGDVGMLDPPPRSGQPGPARLGRGTPRLHRTPQQTGVRSALLGHRYPRCPAATPCGPPSGRTPTPERAARGVPGGPGGALAPTPRVGAARPGRTRLARRGARGGGRASPLLRRKERAGEREGAAALPGMGRRWLAARRGGPGRAGRREGAGSVTRSRAVPGNRGRALRPL